MKSHFVLSSVFAFALMSTALSAAQQDSNTAQPSSGPTSQESKPVEPSAQTSGTSASRSSSTPQSKKKKSKKKTAQKKPAQSGPRRVVVRGGSTAESGGT